MRQYTMPQAANLLGVYVGTVRAWADKEYFPTMPHRVRKHRVVSADALLQFLTETGRDVPPELVAAAVRDVSKLTLDELLLRQVTLSETIWDIQREQLAIQQRIEYLRREAIGS